MNKIIFSILAILIGANSLNAQITGLSTLIKKVDPSVVKIYTINGLNEFESQGSGVIISKDGVCISNYHVLVGAKKAIIITASGKKFEISKVLDYSKSFDLIKFKIDLGSQITIPAAINSELPVKGSNVFAVGYPNGFNVEGESTLTTGIISGIRVMNEEKIIQTSTPITHGSSGGGLFDETGKLIGITTGTLAEDIRDRHANLNKVVPSYAIKKLSRNLNLTLENFYNKLKNSEAFIKGMEAYENRDFENASNYFTDHIKIYPDDAIAWFRLGNSFNQMGRRGGEGGTMNKSLLDMALECFGISISLDTNYYHPYGQSALVYSTLGNINEAKSFAYKAYSIQPYISFTNYVLGKVLNESKAFDLGIEFLTSAIEMANDNDNEFYTHQWYLERAIAYSLLKKYSNAEQDYAKCLELNPDNYDCYFQYGVFLYNTKRVNEACKKFRYLYSIIPNYQAGKDKLKDILIKICQ
jgi:tetratricopeptide (TPR) repeat protein